MKPYPALNVPHDAGVGGEDGGHRDPGSLYYGRMDGRLDGEDRPERADLDRATQQAAAAAAHGFSSYPSHELAVEAPFLFASSDALGADEPDRRDSEAYPLPPLELGAGGDVGPRAGRLTSGSTASAGLAAAAHGQGAHLQSFPFAMNPTPQLSDLVNPTSATANSAAEAAAAAAAAGVHNGGGPVSGTSTHFDPYSTQPLPSSHFDDGTITNVYGTDLPPLEIMIDLAEIYFASLHQHLPFLHRRRFLYTVHHSATLAAAPAQSLVFAVLAIAAAYHDSPIVRAQGPFWYAKARERVDYAINANVHPVTGLRVATLTVEMVQALCLLAQVEMGQSDHQRAFLSLGQAVRIAAMLGLTRMDEDRVADRTGQMNEKRLRPPALHPLPDDPVLLEECRRTMCAVYVLDRFESATVGWPAAIAETDVRVLLPCADELFETGRCEQDGRHNPLWWPVDGAGTDPAQGWEGIRAELEAEGDRERAFRPPQGSRSGQEQGNGTGGSVGPSPYVGTNLPPVSSFGWLCRVVWLGSRIQAETYRATGPPPGGPWNRHVEMDPLGSPAETVEMDRVIEYIRSKLADSVAREAQTRGAIGGPVAQILLILNWSVARAVSGGSSSCSRSDSLSLAA